MDNLFLIALIVGLSLAVLIDATKRRIPNWLTVGIACAGLILQTWSGHGSGLGTGIIGIAVGLLCFLPLHIFGAMGGGDVKLLAGVGAFLGPVNVFLAALITMMVGGVIGLAYITAKGGLLMMIRRYHSMLMLMVAGQLQYIPPAPGEAAGLRFPYALAIACGTVLAII
ncbi:prepilin peptidase [Marinobacter sp. GN3S48]|uniref:A24 family peptidase n=1 Tax=Marinobacter sp. GN3S48 TaxID=3382302 RepID=UPI00387B038A